MIVRPEQDNDSRPAQSDDGGNTADGIMKAFGSGAVTCRILLGISETTWKYSAWMMMFRSVVRRRFT